MDRRSNDGPGIGLGIGAGLLMVLCCAGPALVAGGALGAVGRVLGNPVVVVAGIAVAAIGVVTVLARRGRAQHDCCPPSNGHRATSAEHDQTRRAGSANR